MERKLIENFEWPLFILMLFLCLVGLGLLYSAGYSPDLETSPPVKRQGVAMGVGLVAFFLCMFLNTSFWRRTAFLFYAVGCGLLMVILFHGVVAGGAQRWLEIGAFRMQPSEFMKVGLVLALARLFSRERAPRDGYTLWAMVLPAVVLLIPTLLIAREPDLGTALCHVLIGGSMLLLAGIRLRTAVWVSAFCLVLAVPSWYMLKDYQRDRIQTFLSPELDPHGKGYHALQSKIAVGSGALTGKGFLQGTQTQLRFLPEQTTDFIFSVLAEEWGFIGSLAILALYTMLLFRLLGIAYRCPEPFPAFVTLGVAAMIFWHVVINIGMVVGVLPVVGLTLAFLSYGGSSLVSIMAALGIVAGFSKRRFVFT